MTRPPRRTAFVLVAGLLVVLAAAVAVGRGPGGGSLVVPPAPVDEGAVAVERLVMSMSLEEKAGQLLMTGFRGTELTEDLLAFIDRCRPGGVVLFGGNIRDAAQAAALVADIQEAVAAATGGAARAFVAVDQEGGVVARLLERHGVTVFPGNMALGAVSPPERAEDLAYRSALITGSELRVLGVNMNLAPVLDVNNNPLNPVIGVRSFGEDPALVARLGAAAVRGYRDAGIAAVGKHFPGHGDTALDSHFDLPTVPHDRPRLDRVELVPFRAAIEAGVDAVMTAHVTFPALDPTPGLPATLSAKALTGLLREEMGFAGLILTDAIEMKAVAERYETAEIVERALGAGADIILVGADPERAVEAYEAILAALREGRLTPERLDESLRRILRLKWRLGLLDSAGSPGAGPHTEGCRPSTAAHRRVALEVARASLTLVRDHPGALPLRLEPGDRLLVIAPELLRACEGEVFHGAEETAAGAVTTLGPYLRRHHPTVEELVYPARPSADAAAAAAAAAARARAVLLVTAAPEMRPEEARLVRQVLASAGPARPVVWVSLWSPYDLAAVPSAPTFVAAYSFRHVTLAALAGALFGELPFGGRLPVTLPGITSGRP